MLRTHTSLHLELHLLTNYFVQSSNWQSEVIETNCTSMKQFYCDKLHCIRSDFVQTVVKFVSVKYSLFQMGSRSFWSRSFGSGTLRSRSFGSGTLRSRSFGSGFVRIFFQQRWSLSQWSIHCFKWMFQTNTRLFKPICQKVVVSCKLSSVVRN